MKSLQQRYKDDHSQRLHNGPLPPTAGQDIYLNWPPMTISAAECLATELYNKLMLTNKGSIEVIFVSLTTTTIFKDGVRIPSKSIKLHWRYQQNSKNDNLSIWETNQATS